MGTQNSRPEVVHVQGKGQYNSNYVKAAPIQTYKNFPSNVRKTNNHLITILEAVPRVNTTAHNNVYWWTECHFMPNNDCRLLTCCSPYVEGGNGCLNTIPPSLPRGLICLYHLDTLKLKCETFGTSNSFKNTVPKLQLHTDGNHVSFIGNGDVKILSLQNSQILSRAMELGFGVYKCLSLSTDGNRFAIMAWSSRKTFDLIIYFTSAVSVAESRIDCSKINKNFRGSFGCPERVDCKWSPDSQYIAISQSLQGPLVVVDIKTKESVCNVFPDVIPVGFLSRETTFDFHPQSMHEVMAVGTNDRLVYIINVISGEILCQTEEPTGRDSIDIVRFSPDGDVICVASRNFDIHLYDSVDLTKFHSFNMTETCPNLQPQLNGPNPSVTQVSFSTSGEQLATGSCDGFVRVWKIPKILNLQSLCRLSIQTFVPQKYIHRLRIPSKIVDYLLNIPTMS